MARPTIYNEQLDTAICERLAGGESLRSICRDDAMPAMSTVLLWVVTPGHKFSDHYIRAREAAGFAHADRVADLASMAAEEGIDPQAARAAMDGLKWAAERMSPKKHSPRQEVDHRSEDGSMRPTVDASKLSDAALQELMGARGSESE